VFEFTRIGGWERGLFFALLAQWRCLGFEFTGIGWRNTAEARKRPEIESYNRCVFRIACAMALFAGLNLPALVGETQRRRASAPLMLQSPD
jgi:hypothetical protein